MNSTTKRNLANAENQSKQRALKKEKPKQLPPELYSHDGALQRDVHDPLGVEVADGIIKEEKEWESPLRYGDELELISSTGTSLSRLFSPVSIDLSAVPFIR